MATTINNVKVDFGQGAQAPRVTFLQGCDMDIATIRANLRSIEESEEGRLSALGVTEQGDGRGWICRSGGNFQYSEAESSALVLEILPPFTIFFEAGAIPFQTEVGSLLGTFEESPGAIVQINNAIGASNINAASVEYASFGGGVWVDALNGASGTGYAAEGRPLGTPQDPVNNIPDAVAIDTARGLPQKLFILGDLTLGAGDDVTGFQIFGQNAQRTTLTLGDAATITNVDIQECTVTGILDGDAIVRSGYVYDVTFFSGFIFQCQISGTITLGNATQANILQCYSGVPGTATPTIDMGGSGQSLALRDYSGGIKIENKTGADAASIDLVSGQVKLDLTTVVDGTIVVRGTGKVVDAADEDDYLLTGSYTSSNGTLELLNETNTGPMLTDVWQTLDLDPDVEGTFATFVYKRLLQLTHWIGLK